MAATKLETLSEIFNQKFFRIPDYQRGYAWEEKQLKEFWNDLKNLKDDGSHYAGLITVEEVKEKDKKTERWSEDKWLFDKGLKAYYVIDGQQRLTTCIILIDSIIKFVSKNEINYTPKRNCKANFYTKKQTVINLIYLVMKRTIQVTNISKQRYFLRYPYHRIKSLNKRYTLTI